MNSNEEIFNVYVRAVYNLRMLEDETEYKVFCPLYIKQENREKYNEAPFVMCCNLNQGGESTVYTNLEFRDYINDCINNDKNFKREFMNIMYDYFMCGKLF